MGYEENYLRSDGQCDFYAKYPGAQKNADFRALSALLVVHVVVNVS